MPLSQTTPTLILMDSSSVASSADLSVRERNLILSSASEALDMSSRRKIWEERREGEGRGEEKRREERGRGERREGRKEGEKGR